MFKKLKKKNPRISPLTFVGVVGGILGIVTYMLLIMIGADYLDAGYTVLIVYVCILTIIMLIAHFMRERADSDANEFDLLIGNITIDLLVKLNSPVLICLQDGKIIWKNRAFTKLSGGDGIVGKNLNAYININPELLADEVRFPEGAECEAYGRTFRLRGYTVMTATKRYCMTVWTDVTELKELQAQLINEKTLVSYIVADNLEELIQFTRGNYRNVTSELESVLEKWAASAGGIIKEYEKDRYMFIFEASHLKDFIADKFAILDEIKEIRVGDGNLPVTISIGISGLAGTPEEKSKSALASLDMALQRGGDQAVVRTETGMDFYGGVTKTVQKRTKVRARVIANELVALISKSSNVLIMGHANADYDSFGACVGIARLAMFCGVPMNIIADVKDHNISRCVEKAKNIPGYTEAFIDSITAQDRLRSDTLLVIADVNNPVQFEVPEIADNAQKTVFIDHHRKTGEYAEQPAITYIEPSASSTCELVSEILEQALPAGMLTREEAELMFAGITLDTKKFTVNAGTKTFSAALFLRGEGANPMAVQQEFFTDELEDLKREACFSANTIIYRKYFAISVNNREDTGEEDRIAAAKSADRLLYVKGVSASFALCRIGNAVRISARSNGTVNVQLILEKLKGGGHYDQAAAMIADNTLDDALNKLKAAIDSYIENNVPARQGQ